ncbi:MAG: hypothetical protein M3429_09775, partial [Verrucomicrobiota bacterium]|nr:hypothetical protein [Verrucomicrobiota bacterium]
RVLAGGASPGLSGPWRRGEQPVGRRAIVRADSGKLPPLVDELFSEARLIFMSCNSGLGWKVALGGVRFVQTPFSSFSRGLLGLHPAFRFQSYSRSGAAANRASTLIVCDVVLDRVEISGDVPLVSPGAADVGDLQIDLR